MNNNYQTHFEENPRELSLLKHDKVLQNSRIQRHLKFLPNYLVPAPLQQAINQSKTQRLVASITGVGFWLLPI